MTKHFHFQAEIYGFIMALWIASSHAPVEAQGQKKSANSPTNSASGANSGKPPVSVRSAGDTKAPPNAETRAKPQKPSASVLPLASAGQRLSALAEPPSPEAPAPLRAQLEPYTGEARHWDADKDDAPPPPPEKGAYDR